MTFVLIRVLLQPHSVRPLQGEVAVAAREGGVAAGGGIPSVGNLELELEFFLKVCENYLYAYAWHASMHSCGAWMAVTAREEWRGDDSS